MNYGTPGLLVALPMHSPCGLEGCGHHEAGSVRLVCGTRRVFKVTRRDAKGKAVAWDPVDKPGCGKVSGLNRDSGLREWVG